MSCPAHAGSCPAIVERGRCTPCKREVRRARGTTTEQGYGFEHQQRRVDLIANAIGTPCPDCDRIMWDPANMVADHGTPLSTDRTSIADRVHCRDCSNKQGGRISRRNNTS